VTAPHFFERPGLPRIAYRFREGRGPAILFLPGYKSDMTGSKALALDAWAARAGRPLLRLDYTGCGESGGAFEEGTLTRWRDDVLALVDATEGPVVLVGSSMGGWLMLLVAVARAHRVAGLVGVAAAPDFTDWGFSQDEKIAILRDGQIARPSEYGDPLVTTRAFWQSGEAHRMLQRPILIDCPVRLLQGQRDADVPWATALHLAERLRSADVQLTLVKDGDHRLSRDADIALLLATVERLVEAL
jgi:pimeloyl-ACP methyl ester carboxylesterase